MSAELLLKLTEALGVDPKVLEDLMERDRQEALDRWRRWADIPIEPYVVARVFTAIYCRIPLGQRFTRVEEAKVFTSRFAKRRHHKCSLIWSRRLSYSFDEMGKLTGGGEAEPGRVVRSYVQIGSRKGLFQSEDGSIRFQAVDEPPRGTAITGGQRPLAGQ